MAAGNEYPVPAISPGMPKRQQPRAMCRCRQRGALPLQALTLLFRPATGWLYPQADAFARFAV